MNDLRRIPILLCFDANYANYAAVATYSAFKNTKTSLYFYWIITPESELIAKKIKNHLEKFNIEIELIAGDITKFENWKAEWHFTTAIYLRLLAPDLLPNENKIIYIDCDTLVLNDLTELYDTRLDDAVIGGVEDKGGAISSKVPRSDDDVYLNAGVLLMDLLSLRNSGFLEQSMLIYQQYKDEITWADQCIINKYAERKKLSLHPKWNRQIFSNASRDSQFLVLSDPTYTSVLHFVGGIKPWQQWCNPTLSKFWWALAEDLQLNDLKPIEISTDKQLMALAKVLDENKHFEEASNRKSQIIAALYRKIEELIKQ